MKHFIVGPVEMYPCTKEIYKDGIVYFRTPEFSKIVLNCLSKLSCLIGNSEESSMIYLTASGTAAMEAVVENTVFDNDKVLVINGGTFGHRFCELLKYHNKNYESLNLSWGEALNEDLLNKFDNQNFTMLFVNLHETSVGQLYDIELLKRFCKKNNLLLVVDAISTFLADDYNMDKNGIDVTIASSQKGLCLSAGLSFVSVSKRIKEKILNAPNPSSCYFNFKDYFKNIERGQTPYTPAVHIIYELQAILNYIDSFGGKEKWLENIKQKAQYFRKKAQEFGYSIPKYPLSNMLTPLIFNDVKASDVVLELKDKYQIYVNPCGGEMADKLIRVSHIGNTNLQDIDDLFEKMNIVVGDLKNKELVYDRK
ncbi:MAG: alanine--glyoxylate aminotransferase family protein [Candidatus Gastranaerophilales bacterium]|nr:alanine--glyoxylate aminotransferase family protein [Candidatus Gastranaerophilales bacterium]